MNRQRRQIRPLIFIVIAVFLGFLIQPQVSTLHHVHPEGEHAHVHLQHLVSAAAEHAHDHPHSSDHPHSHTHATDASHTHQHPGEEHLSQTTPAYKALASTAGGHWHIFSALQLTSLTKATWLSRHLAQPFSLEEKPRLIPLPLFTVFQPRAPPAVL